MRQRSTVQLPVQLNPWAAHDAPVLLIELPMPPSSSPATPVPPYRLVVPRTAAVPWRRIGIAARALAVFVLLWWALAAWKDNPIQLPGPDRVGLALLDLARKGELVEHATVSVAQLLLSLGLALLLAVPLGLAMGLSPRLEAWVDPAVELLRPISDIAWIPLALFIFGVGNALPVFIMTYVAFFPLLLNTVAGVRGVDRRLLDAARTMGLPPRAMLRHVVLPSALPSMVVGLRLAFAGAWAAVVAAELIGAPTGLGFAIEWYRQLLMSPKVFAFIALIGVLGLVGDAGLRALQRRLMPWSAA
jgi:ABC-type nitrate/sulfonate/bicarbonate transport system permease component